MRWALAVAWLMLNIAATLFSFAALLLPVGPWWWALLMAIGIGFFGYLGMALGRLQDDLRRD